MGNIFSLMIALIFIFLLYSGWFVWLLVYFTHSRKYTKGKAIALSFLVVFGAFYIGTAISDLIVAFKSRNSIFSIAFGTLWIVFPYFMLLIMLCKRRFHKLR